MKMLVTNAIYRYEYGDNVVYFQGRAEDGSRVNYRYVANKPYFFVEDINGIDGIGLTGKPLRKIVVETPKDVINERAKYEMTYEANVPFVNRVKYDLGIKNGLDLETMRGTQVDIMPRIWYIDIEVNDKNGFPKPDLALEPILSFVINDNFSSRYSLNITKPVDSMAIVDKIGNMDFRIHVHGSEKDMLNFLKNSLKGRGAPDIIIGYNIKGFDLIYLINRAQRFGIDLDFEQFVIIDLMDIILRLHENDIASATLEYVANLILGEGKVQHKEKIWEMYYKDPEKLLFYNWKDVNLLPRLDDRKKVGATNFLLDLSKLTGCDLGRWNAGHIVYSYLYHFLHGTNIRLPTYPINKQEDVEGAFVADPLPGLYKFVIVLDFSSYYPNIMRTFNLSPDTKDNNGTIVTRWAKFVSHKTKYGLIPRAVAGLLDYRTKIKEKMKTPSIEEAEKEALNDIQRVVKELSNSFYGVIADHILSLYDPQIANAITGLAREGTYFVVDLVTPMGYKFIYSDTDSVFLTHEKYLNMTIEEIVEDARKLSQLVTSKLKEFAKQYGVDEDKVTLDMKYEKTYTDFAIVAKKRYAGLTIDGKIDTKGIEVRRSNTSNYTKQKQVEFIRKIFADKREAILWYQEEEKRWNNEQISVEQIGLVTGIRKSIQEYAPGHQIVKAIKNSEKLKVKPDTSLSKIKIYFIHGYGAVAYDIDAVPAKKLRIDYQEHKRRCFTLPLSPFYDLIKPNLKKFIKKPLQQTTIVVDK